MRVLDNPIIIALTGGIASGKSTVANLFNQLGVDIIDTDVIAKQVVAPDQPGWSAICQHFGRAILLPNRHINRAKLRDTIFNEPDQRAWVDQILHPLIRHQAAQEIAASSSPYCMLVIPLLNQNTQQHYPHFARILLVDLPEIAQRERLKARDNIDDRLAQHIIDCQPSRQTRLTLANDIIDNTCSQDQLSLTVAKLHQHYLQLAS